MCKSKKLICVKHKHVLHMNTGRHYRFSSEAATLNSPSVRGALTVYDAVGGRGGGGGGGVSRSSHFK